MPSTLVLQPQESAIDVSVVEDAAVDAASRAIEGPSLIRDENGDSYCAPLPEKDVERRPEVSTLSVRTDLVESAVDRALGALVELAKGDPRQADRIRRHFAGILASTGEP